MAKLNKEKKEDWIIFSLDEPVKSEILTEQTKSTADYDFQFKSKQEKNPHRLYTLDDFSSLALNILMEMNFDYRVDDHTAHFLLNKFIHHLYCTDKLGLQMIKQHLNLPAFADDSEIIEALKKNDY